MEVGVICHKCKKKFTLEPEVVQYETTKVILIVGSDKDRQVTCPHCGASNMVSPPYSEMIRPSPGTITRLEP